MIGWYCTKAKGFSYLEKPLGKFHLNKQERERERESAHLRLDFLKPRASFHVQLLRKPGELFVLCSLLEIRVKNTVEQVKNATSVILISYFVFYIFISICLLWSLAEIPLWQSSYKMNLVIYILIFFCSEFIQENIKEYSTDQGNFNYYYRTVRMIRLCLLPCALIQKPLNPTQNFINLRKICWCRQDFRIKILTSLEAKKAYNLWVLSNYKDSFN